MTPLPISDDIQRLFDAIAENLIGLRGRMGQEELAKKSGVSRSTITKIEAKKGCSLTALVKLAKALSVPVDELIISKDERQWASASAVRVMRMVRGMWPEEPKTKNDK